MEMMLTTTQKSLGLWKAEVDSRISQFYGAGDSYAFDPSSNEQWMFRWGGPPPLRQYWRAYRQVRDLPALPKRKMTLSLFVRRTNQLFPVKVRFAHTELARLWWLLGTTPKQYAAVLGAQMAAEAAMQPRTVISTHKDTDPLVKGMDIVEVWQALSLADTRWQHNLGLNLALPRGINHIVPLEHGVLELTYFQARWLTVAKRALTVHKRAMEYSPANIDCSGADTAALWEEIEALCAGDDFIFDKVQEKQILPHVLQRWQNEPGANWLRPERAE